MVSKVFLLVDCIIFAGAMVIPFVTCQAYSSGNNGNSQTTTPPGGNCAKIPNIIPSPYSSISAAQLLSGKPWYNYAIYSNVNNTSPPTKKNVVSYYEGWGRGSEPTKNMAADIVTQEQTRYDATGACSSLLEVAWFTVDGRQIGPYFDISGNNLLNAAFDDSILWSTDMSTYILFHNCDQRNPTTGNCDFINVYVHATTKPNAMSNSQKATIAAAVNKALAPYCVTMDSFQIYTWDDNLAQCGRLGTFPACFQAQVDAYKFLVER